MPHQEMKASCAAMVHQIPIVRVGAFRYKAQGLQCHQLIPIHTKTEHGGKPRGGRAYLSTAATIRSVFGLVQAGCRVKPSAKVRECSTLGQMNTMLVWQHRGHDAACRDVVTAMIENQWAIGPGHLRMSPASKTDYCITFCSGT